MKLMRMASAVLAVLLLLLTATAASAVPKRLASAAVQITVSGTVYNSEGPAIPGATVEVSVLDKTGVYVPAATLVTDAVGQWTYTGKTGDYRFAFTAPGTAPQTQDLSMPDKVTYTLDVTLQQLYCSISGRVLNGLAGLPMPSCMVTFYRQNADGTWPATSFAWNVTTSSDGTYTSGNLAPGIYRVRFFGVHTGAQYYQYATTYDTATPVDISVLGQAATGIDGWFGMP